MNMDMENVVGNETQTIDALYEIDQQIKKHLYTESKDIDKCLAVMRELEVVLLQTNDVMLKQNPAVVATMKKCRKYEGSEEVVKKAELIYRQMKTICMREFLESEDTNEHEENMKK